ncbi:MAG: hypothetical protein PHE56_16625 [Bacteroidales bacterium]|nr:hypothetical protein [Bacteroidales bacterium]
MNITKINTNTNFRSAHISDEGKALLNSKQKNAIYSIGNSRANKHITAQIIQDEMRVPTGIVISVFDKKAHTTQGKTFAKMAVKPQVLKNKISRLLRSIK